jgi:transposase
MTIDISQHILRLKGQRVNEIELAEDGAKVIVQGNRLNKQLTLLRISESLL